MGVKEPIRNTMKRKSPMPFKAKPVQASLAAALLAATAMTAPATAEDKLDVVASFSIIGDFARIVGGDRIALTTLVGSDGDAHVYEPKPADAAMVAQVLLVNGLQFEGFLPRLLEASGTKASVVELTKGAEILKPEEDGHDHGAEKGHGHAHDHASETKNDHGHAHEKAAHDHGAYDPHAWQSVQNAIIYVGNIAQALCAADKAGCDAYKANAAAYTAELNALDAEIRAAVAAIPEDRRVVITAHDAFGYFEHAYGLDFIAPEGVSTDAEASAADVAAIITQIKEDKASAVFLENITDPRLVEQIAADTGIKVGGTLFSDALTGENGPAASYVQMMRHNISTIRSAITGS
jgi:zinc/manganese transport system substrate-binding protein